ncbi:unnamed protein product, partial [Tilletia controversa]
LTQGGANGLNVISDYIVKYGYSSLAFTKEQILAQLTKESYVTPTEWNSYGRQIGVYMKYGYVPFAVFDTESTGRQTREASRTLEYAFNDFGVALAAKELGDDKLHADMIKRSMNYRNIFDPTVKFRGFKGYPQKRRTNGEQGTLMKLNSKLILSSHVYAARTTASLCIRTRPSAALPTMRPTTPARCSRRTFSGSSRVLPPSTPSGLRMMAPVLSI